MIFLGNQTVEQIERRLHITLSEEHKAFLKENRQETVNNTPLKPGAWHCYDIPFMLMTHDMETATKYRDLFSSYDLSKGEAFQIGWES